MNKPQQPVVKVCQRCRESYIGKSCQHVDCPSLHEAAQDSPEGLVLPPLDQQYEREIANLQGLMPHGPLLLKLRGECRERQLMDALRRATEAEGRVKELEAENAKDFNDAEDQMTEFKAKVAELQTLLDGKNAALEESDKERNKWYDIAQEAINGK